MKYIRFDNGDFILFSSTISHKHAAKISRQGVLSAGFVDIDINDKLNCYGESETLKKTCQVEDSRMLCRQLEPK